jgi:toxin-antitoxin system PIN domain toxin
VPRFLADVNFILAILHPEHQHSNRANNWLNRVTANGDVVVCRIVQMGALRLLTKRLVMGDAVLTGRDAWSFLQCLFSDDRFAFSDEPAGLAGKWQNICEALPSGVSVDTDAYLAAFALAADLTVVTFDGGFSRFHGLKMEIPPTT